MQQIRCRQTQPQLKVGCKKASLTKGWVLAREYMCWDCWVMRGRCVDKVSGHMMGNSGKHMEDTLGIHLNSLNWSFFNPHLLWKLFWSCIFKEVPNPLILLWGSRSNVWEEMSKDAQGRSSQKSFARWTHPFIWNLLVIPRQFYTVIHW